MNSGENKFKDHCGIVGIFAKNPENVPVQLFYTLFSLQHRGQESAGIAYYKGDELVVYKDLGMVSSVLSRYLNEKRLSNIGIGHVRYSTHGGNKIENTQPILACCNKGNIALAHNGNISNAEKLKKKLVDEGSIFQSTSDTELILHLISRSRKTTFIEALIETLTKLKGAYSMVMVHNDSLIAVRDPEGFRPLFMGKNKNMTVFSSETCALDILQIKEYREVKPGEIITIKKNSENSRIYSASPKLNQCIFELIYFARPDSNIFGKSVHLMRKKIGAALAKTDNVKADIVVPVPSGGTSAAMGYSEESGLPFELGLSRNHYAGRSFIMPTSAQRELAVRVKLNPVREAIKGKRIILVDDSLVRGTTSKIIVKLLNEAGAKEVHLRLSSPEIINPCYFGIDTPTHEELISNSLTPEKIAKHIGADSVMFLPLAELKNCSEQAEDFCFACFGDKYQEKDVY